MLELYVALKNTLLMFSLEKCMASRCKIGALLLLPRESKLLFGKKSHWYFNGSYYFYVHALYNADCFVNAFIGSRGRPAFLDFWHFMPIIFFRSPNIWKTEQWQLILLRKHSCPVPRLKINKPYWVGSELPGQYYMFVSRFINICWKEQRKGFNLEQLSLHVLLLALWLSCLFTIVGLGCWGFFNL